MEWKEERRVRGPEEVEGPCMVLRASPAAGSQSRQNGKCSPPSAPLSLLSGIKREMSQPGLSLHANLRPLQSAQWCRNQGVYGKHESKTNNGNQSQTSGPQMKSEAVRLEINLWPGDPRHKRGNAMQDSAAGFNVDPLRLGLRDADAIFLHLSVSSSPPAHSPFPVPI